MEEIIKDMCKPQEAFYEIVDLCRIAEDGVLSTVTNIVSQSHEPKTVALGFWHEPPNEEMEKQKIVYLRDLHYRIGRSVIERYSIEDRHDLFAGQEYSGDLYPITEAVCRNGDAIFGNYNLEKIREICSKGRSPGHLYTPKSAGAKIILDTFFVLAVILKCTYERLIQENDPIFLHGENLQSIIHDMFLLSNQIPFFLLEGIYCGIFGGRDRRSMKNEIARFMESELCINPGTKYHESDNLGDNHYGEPEHLCAAVYNLWVQDSYEFMERHKKKELIRRRRSRRQRVIRNATELQRAGIGFKGVDRQTFSLIYRHGLLEIPVLTITTETEHFLRQCIVYEKNSRDDRVRIIKDYCVFMDCLIHSTKDVQLLRENGVIESYLHDDQDIVDLFDRLGERVPSSTKFCYSDLFDQVNDHCVRRWNSWKANLRRNYFKDDNQLEAASFMLAIYIILPVTILQTVYTILSYYSSS